ncbi:Uncharacterized protein TPAR_06528, partial [Tolypocladium paradoxum]
HHKLPHGTRNRLLHPLIFQHPAAVARVTAPFPARSRRYASRTVKMADRVHRITMFKIPKAEDQQTLIESYKIVDATNQKDGKPYILSLVVGRAEDDPRSQGFTVVCKTEFASLDDLKYYDNACQAHQSLRAVAQTLTIEGIQTVYFKPQVVGGAAP